MEEQFYLVFPLIVLACARWRLSRHRVIWVLFSLSLVASIAAVKVAPDAAFYFSPLRAWELLLGALIVVSAPVPQSSRQKDIAALVGLLLIAGAVFFFKSRTPFPGAFAMIPSAGAALILWSGIGGPSRNAAFLTSPSMVGVGIISYSLYLWHWPLIVFTQYVLMRKPNGFEALLLIAASVMFAYVSWRFIEEPIRRGRRLGTKSSFVTAALTGLTACVALGAVIVDREGLPERLTPELAAMMPYVHGYDDWKGCHNVKADRIQGDTLCVLGQKDKTPTFVLFGDSHAAALSPAISAAAVQEGVSGYQYTDQEMPLPAGRAPALFLDFLRAHPNVKLVILTGIWERRIAADKLGPEKTDAKLLRSTEEKKRAYSDGLFELVKLFPNVKFALVEDIPTGDQLDGSLFARASFLGLDQASKSSGITRQKYELQRAAYVSIFEKSLTLPNVLVSSVAAKLCDDLQCPAVRDGKILYRDWSHLSPWGAVLLTGEMRTTLRRGLGLIGPEEVLQIRSAYPN